MALAEVARLEQLQRLVGQLEQADQIGDRGAAAADPSGQLLFGQAELLDQRRAGACLLDRVEVLADHVLDQRRLQPLGLAWSRTTAGTFSSPACWAARQRRSPATSS